MDRTSIYSSLEPSTIRYYLRIGKIKAIAKTGGDYMLFSKEQVKEIKKIINSLIISLLTFFINQKK
ncbi:MAG: MerR family transcriptional regulator [Endomicrobium sp.]|nr:MerR family transcriptional regulator [Endomicrobium sp.]